MFKMKLRLRDNATARIIESDEELQPGQIIDAKFRFRVVEIDGEPRVFPVGEFSDCDGLIASLEVERVE